MISPPLNPGKGNSMEKECDCESSPTWKIYGHSLSMNRKTGELKCGRTGLKPNKAAHGKMIDSITEFMSRPQSGEKGNP